MFFRYTYNGDDCWLNLNHIRFFRKYEDGIHLWDNDETIMESDHYHISDPADVERFLKTIRTFTAG